jgi:hypothetical protein
MCFQLGVSEDCARNLKPAIPLIGLMTHAWKTMLTIPLNPRSKPPD